MSAHGGWSGSGMGSWEAQEYLPPSSGKTKGESCSFKAGPERRTSPLSAACTQLCFMATQLYRAGPQRRPTPYEWVGEGRFARRKALKCYAIISWAFGPTVVNCEITFPERKTRCQSQRYCQPKARQLASSLTYYIN